MDEEKYTTLISRLEVYSREHPTLYKVRVGLLAAFGFLCLFFFVLLLLLIVAALLLYGRFHWLTLYVAWLPIVLIGVVLRSLWIEFPEPDGKHLKRDEAPALFDLVESVESALRSRHVHHILLTDKFSASVMQIPRLGIFGWRKNYLCVGLPLMQSLSSEQFQAVIAHELGHLSGARSRFRVWIYRVRETWDQVDTRMQEEHRYGAFIFEAFLNWYLPFFTAYSFVLARAHELEADAQAVKFAGTEHFAKSLINLRIRAKYLSETFWPNFFKQADTQFDTPTDVFTQFARASKSVIPTEAARKWLRLGLAEQTGYEDTHPSFADRLRAIGYLVVSTQIDKDGLHLLSPPATGDEVAANYYVGKVMDDFISSRNRWWRDQVGFEWRERYKLVKELEKTRLALQEKAQSQILTIDERWELARCLLETGGPIAALATVRELQNDTPEDAVANYHLGLLLLVLDDDEGIEHIEKAMTLEEESTLSGCELIFCYLKERGRDEEAEPYRVRHGQFQPGLVAAEE